MNDFIEDPFPTNIHKKNFKDAQIQTHSFCNAECIMCPYKETKKTLDHGIMDWDLFTKVVNDLIEYPSLKVITLTLQNEPLLEKRLFDQIKYIKNRNSTTKVIICSNGYLLDDTMVRSLIDAGLDRLIFSINGITEDTFNKIEKGLKFNIVVNNLFNLINKYSRKLKIVVKLMIIRDNAIELGKPGKFSDIIMKVKEEGVEIDIKPISNRAGSLSGYKDMLIHERLQSSKRKLYCHDIFESVYVLFNGDVITCCADWLRKTVLGNLKDRNFEDIWNSREAFNRRVDIINKPYDELEPCKGCNQAWNIMENRKKANIHI